MTKRTISLTVAALLMAASSYAQTNPCTAALPTGVVLNPTKIQATLSEQTATLADGTPAVTEYQIGYFAQGATNPIQTATIPKANMTLIAGTTDCYEGAPAGLASVPIGPTVYVSALKARRVPATGAAEESAWSAVSNPFGRTAAPLAPPKVVIR